MKMEALKGFRSDSSLLLASINSVGESMYMTANLERVLQQVENRPLSVVAIIGFSNQGPPNLFAYVHQFLQESCEEVTELSINKSVFDDKESSPPNQLEVWTTSRPFFQTVHGKDAAVILLYTKCSVADFSEKNSSILSSFVQLNLHASSTTVIYHPEMLSESIAQQFGAFINKCIPVVENHENKPCFQKLALLIEITKMASTGGSSNGRIIGNNKLPQKAAAIWSSTAKSFEAFDYHFIPQLRDQPDLDEPLTNNNKNSFNVHLDSFISNLIFNLQIRKVNDKDLSAEALRMIFKNHVSGANGKDYNEIKDKARDSTSLSREPQGTQKNTASIKTRLLKQVKTISEREQTGLAGSTPTPILTLPMTPKKSAPNKGKYFSDSDTLDDEVSKPKQKYPATRKFAPEVDEQSDIESELGNKSQRGAYLRKPLGNSKPVFSSEDGDDDSSHVRIKTKHSHPATKNKLAKKWNSTQSESENEEAISTRKKSHVAPSKTKWGKGSSEADSGDEDEAGKSIPKSGWLSRKPTTVLPPGIPTLCNSSSDEENSKNCSINKWLSSSTKTVANENPVGKANPNNYAGISSIKKSPQISDSDDSDHIDVRSLKPKPIAHKFAGSLSRSESTLPTEIGLNKNLSHDSKKPTTFLNKTKVFSFQNKFGATKGEPQVQSTFSMPSGYESSNDETDISFTKSTSGPSKSNLKYSKSSPMGGSSNTRKDVTESNLNTDNRQSKYAAYFSQKIKKGRQNVSSESD